MDLLLFILQEEQKNNSYSIQKYIWNPHYIRRWIWWH
jgi:hypothetical protein